MTVIEAESFFMGQEKVGVLLRAIQTDALVTMLAFTPPGRDMVQLRQETQFAGSPLQWSSFAYVDDAEGIQRRGTRENGRVTIDGPATSVPASAIPSYAAHLLLRQLLLSDANRLEFAEFSEGGTMEAVDARLERHPEETVELLSGTARAQRVVLTRNGVAANTFWCQGCEVVKSDWQGAVSYLAKSEEELLDGLPPQFSTISRHFRGPTSQ